MDNDPAPDDIQGHLRNFTSKVEEIQLYNPNGRIIVSPILPTCIPHINSRAKEFNNLFHDYVVKSNTAIRFLNFSDFVGFDGLLDKDLRCFNNPRDPLHIGRQGILKLTSKFKGAILSPRTDSRRYSDVLSRMGAHAPT